MYNSLRSPRTFLVFSFTFLTLAFISCSSDSTTGPSSTTQPAFGDSIKLSFIDHPEAAILVTGQGPGWMDAKLTANGKPIEGTAGISVFYFDPIRDKYISSPYRVMLWSFYDFPRDTTFAIDFYADVLGTRVGPVRKTFDLRLHVAPPAFDAVKGYPVDNHSYRINWHREPSDDETDTLFIITPTDTEKYFFPAPDSTFLYTKAVFGRTDYIELHTLGGITHLNTVVAPVYTSRVFRLYNFLNPGHAVGLRFKPMGLDTVDYNEADSAHIVFDPGNSGKLRLISSYYLMGRGPYVTFGLLQPGTVDTIMPGYGTAYNTSVPLDGTATGPMWCTVQWPNHLTQGLLEIEPQANGRLIGTDSFGDFVEVRVRFQP